MNGMSLIFMLVLVGGMMFFTTRTQKKRQTEQQNLLNSMKIGDKVVTIGGLHGVISEFDEENRTVFINCEGIELEFERSAIRTVKPRTTVKNDSDVTTVDLNKEETTTENENEKV